VAVGFPRFRHSAELIRGSSENVSLGGVSSRVQSVGATRIDVKIPGINPLVTEGTGFNAAGKLLGDDPKWHLPVFTTRLRGAPALGVECG